MASVFGFALDVSSALRGFDRLEDRARTVAIPRALNRSAASGRTFMARSIAEDMALKVGSVRDRIGIAKATAEAPVAQVSVAGARIPLIEFGARQTARGVSANTGKGRQLYPHTFIARVRGPLPTGIVSPGHEGVFQRKGKARLPIAQRYGASLPHVFRKHLPAGIAYAESVLAKNLEHELEFALKQLEAR